MTNLLIFSAKYERGKAYQMTEIVIMKLSQIKKNEDYEEALISLISMSGDKTMDGWI